MSHWGRGTGFDYNTERLDFLSQSILTERRAAMQAATRPLGFMPLGNRRALPPLEPLPQPIVQTTSLEALSQRAHSQSLRRFGNMPPVERLPGLDGQLTCTQLAYRKPTTPFMRAFGQIDRTNGKLRDETTNFREAVYEVWNISGAKNPAVFRP